MPAKKKTAPAVATKDVVDLEFQRIDKIQAAIRHEMDRVGKVSDACDLWLTDPADPDKYIIEPRASELMVVYIETDPKGRQIRRKERLQKLLDRALGKDRNVLEVNYRHADPRELLLKAVEKKTSLLELMAKIEGQATEISINVLNLPVWLMIKKAFLTAAEQYPEVLRLFSQEMKKIKEQDNASKSN